MHRKRKILIVEDDRDICRTVELYLSSLGFEILTAFDGQEGLEKARIAKPDLIILDLGLPHLPGEELCKELRKEEAYQQIPIIMVTAKNTDVDRVVGRVIGADYYITKPFDFDVLEAKIKVLLEQNDAQSQDVHIGQKKIEAETVAALGRSFVKGNIPEIDGNLCTGCALCVKQCQKIGFNVLEIKAKVAKVVRPQQCIGDGSCLLVCPVKAMFLLSQHDPESPPIHLPE